MVRLGAPSLVQPHGRSPHSHGTGGTGRDYSVIDGCGSDGPSHRDPVSGTLGLAVIVPLGCLRRGHWLRRLNLGGGGLRYVAAEILREFGFIVGIDRGVVTSAGHRNVREAAIHK